MKYFRPVKSTERNVRWGYRAVLWTKGEQRSHDRRGSLSETESRLGGASKILEVGRLSGIRTSKFAEVAAQLLLWVLFSVVFFLRLTMNEATRYFDLAVRIGAHECKGNTLSRDS